MSLHMTLLHMFLDHGVNGKHLQFNQPEPQSLQAVGVMLMLYKLTTNAEVIAGGNYEELSCSNQLALCCEQH
jgi:hypothetical protein